MNEYQKEVIRNHKITETIVTTLEGDSSLDSYVNLLSSKGMIKITKMMNETDYKFELDLPVSSIFRIFSMTGEDLQTNCVSQVNYVIVNEIIVEYNEKKSKKSNQSRTKTEVVYQIDPVYERLISQTAHYFISMVCYGGLTEEEIINKSIKVKKGSLEKILKLAGNSWVEIVNFFTIKVIKYSYELNMKSTKKKEHKVVEQTRFEIDPAYERLLAYIKVYHMTVGARNVPITTFSLQKISNLMGIDWYLIIEYFLINVITITYEEYQRRNNAFLKMTAKSLMLKKYIECDRDILEEKKQTKFPFRAVIPKNDKLLNLRIENLASYLDKCEQYLLEMEKQKKANKIIINKEKITKGKEIIVVKQEPTEQREEKDKVKADKKIKKKTIFRKKLKPNDKEEEIEIEEEIEEEEEPIEFKQNKIKLKINKDVKSIQDSNHKSTNIDVKDEDEIENTNVTEEKNSNDSNKNVTRTFASSIPTKTKKTLIKDVTTKEMPKKQKMIIESTSNKISQPSKVTNLRSKGRVKENPLKINNDKFEEKKVLEAVTTNINSGKTDDSNVKLEEKTAQNEDKLFINQSVVVIEEKKKKTDENLIDPIIQKIASNDQTRSVTPIDLGNNDKKNTIDNHSPQTNHCQSSRQTYLSLETKESDAQDSENETSFIEVLDLEGKPKIVAKKYFKQIINKPNDGKVIEVKDYTGNVITINPTFTKYLDIANDENKLVEVEDSSGKKIIVRQKILTQTINSMGNPDSKESIEVIDYNGKVKVLHPRGSIITKLINKKQNKDPIIEKETKIPINIQKQKKVLNHQTDDKDESDNNDITIKTKLIVNTSQKKTKNDGVVRTMTRSSKVKPLSEELEMIEENPNESVSHIKDSFFTRNHRTIRQVHLASYIIIIIMSLVFTYHIVGLMRATEYLNVYTIAGFLIAPIGLYVGTKGSIIIHFGYTYDVQGLNYFLVILNILIASAYYISNNLVGESIYSICSDFKVELMYGIFFAAVSSALASNLKMMEIYNELGTLEDVQISEANDSQSSLSMLTEGFLNSSPMIENRILKNLKIPQLGKTTPIEQALVNTEKFLEDNWKGYSIIPNNINVGSTTPGCIPVEEQLRVEMNTHLMTKMMDPSIFSKYFNLFTLIHFATYLVFIIISFVFTYHFVGLIRVYGVNNYYIAIGIILTPSLLYLGTKGSVIVHFKYNHELKLVNAYLLTGLLLTIGNFYLGNNLSFVGNDIYSTLHANITFSLMYIIVIICELLALYLNYKMMDFYHEYDYVSSLKTKLLEVYKIN